MKIALLYNEHTPTLEAMLSGLKDFDTTLLKENKNSEDYDLIIGVGINDGFRGLACHYSLLPAFNSEEPVRDAVLAGVKVTGITIYYTEPFKIIAQYPLMIDNLSHFDDILTRLKYLEQVIYPLVAEKYAKNEPFEVQSLLTSGGCSGSCNTCGRCK